MTLACSASVDRNVTRTYVPLEHHCGPRPRFLRRPKVHTHTDSLHNQFKMKRNPRKLKWTKAFRKSAGKEMIVDSTLTFAARRNIPTRYNRDLVATTLKAMQRVSEIRVRRERVFYKKRMEGNKERQRQADAKLVAENGHLLPRGRTTEELEAEITVVDGEEVAPVRTRVDQRKLEKKRRLLVAGGVEEMDVS